jgi:5-methylcytosine-specific restriction endonuclease McrA
MDKQAVADELAALLQIQRDELGPGSKEHLDFLQRVASALGLSAIGTKHVVAQRVVEHLGGAWTRDCYSSGDTVQARALQVMLDAIRTRLGEVRASRLLALDAAKRGLQKDSPAPAGNRTPPRLTVGEADFVRCQRVVAWILMQADGVCELCCTRAPFDDARGEPFLEVHHVKPLAEGGADTVDNAVALCPNCHRAVHHAGDRRDRQSQLRDRLASRGYGSPERD